MLIKHILLDSFTCYQVVVLTSISTIKSVWRERVESLDVVLIKRVPRKDSNCRKAGLEIQETWRLDATYFRNKLRHNCTFPTLFWLFRLKLESCPTYSLMFQSYL